MARLREVEGALVTALDEVESESMQSTKMLQEKDGETSRMKAMVAANKAEITRMAIELEGAREQLQEASRIADEAQACFCSLFQRVQQSSRHVFVLPRNICPKLCPVMDVFCSFWGIVFATATLFMSMLK